jgi:hypothetical protein
MNQFQAWLGEFCRAVANGSPLAYASIGVGIFVAALYFKIVFKDFHGFFESLDGVGRWSLFGFLNWGTLKFVIWIMLSVAGGYSAYYHLPRLLPQWFAKG